MTSVDVRHVLPLQTLESVAVPSHPHPPGELIAKAPVEVYGSPNFYLENLPILVPGVLDAEVELL